MSELFRARPGINVRWMAEDDAPDRFEKLCVDREVPVSGYPNAARLRSLQQACPNIILGVFDDEDRLLGGAVLLPLRSSSRRRLDQDELAEGKRLGPEDLRSGWRRRGRGTDLYASIVVAERGSGLAVLRAAAAVFPQLLGERSAFARTATKEGIRAAEYLRFAQHGKRGLWRRSPVERRSSWSLAPRRLAQYDNTQNAVTSFLRVARPALAALYAAALLAALAGLLFPLGAFTTFISGLFAIPATSIAPVIGTAATVGGLALTVFFFTAQSRLSGINQYGVTAMYRVRDLMPLVLLTTLTVGSGTGFLLTRGTSTTTVDTLPMMFAAVAVVSQLALLLFIFLLSLGLIRGLDPVAVARQFAREIHGQDADEWGLVSVVSDPDDPLGAQIELNQRRVNFGLRDPLMPIHELILAATPQRYGQLLAVLAERIATEYGCTWVQQFPDSGDWTVFEAGKKLRLRDARQKLRIRLVGAERLRRERLQLTMLLLHYFRRIHRNVNLTIQKDFRRQAAQFVLARLITVLARSKPLPGIHRDEIALVLTLCVDALLRVGADYSPGGVYEKSTPEVPNELLRGFVTAIDALDANDFDNIADEAALTLNWLFTAGAVDRARILTDDPENPIPTLANQRLVKTITRQGRPVFPSYVDRSPWEAAIPDRRVREGATDDPIDNRHLKLGHRARSVLRRRAPSSSNS